MLSRYVVNHFAFYAETERLSDVWLSKLSITKPRSAQECRLGLTTISVLFRTLSMIGAINIEPYLKKKSTVNSRFQNAQRMYPLCYLTSPKVAATTYSANDQCVV